MEENGRFTAEVGLFAIGCGALHPFSIKRVELVWAYFSKLLSKTGANIDCQTTPRVVDDQ